MKARWLGVPALLGLAALLLVWRPPAAGAETIATLAGQTHFHGLAVDRNDPSRLYLATHHGLYVVDREGRAERVSDTRDDFMGFTAHPSDPSIFYASGHPASGGNTGFITSGDGGRSWRKLSDGAGGPVDFHQMTVSRANPEVIYGVHGGLQKSMDGGRTWSVIAPPPEGLISLAAGGRPGVLFAATRLGLFKSADDGRNWQPAHDAREPATMVHLGADGTLYAFILGVGLVRTKEDEADWQVVGGDLANRPVLHLATAPADANLLYAIAFDPASRSQALLRSENGGQDWAPLGRR